MLGSDQRAKVAALLSHLAFWATLCWEEAKLLSAELLHAEELHEHTERHLPTGSRAQMGAQQAVMALVIVGATLIIGIVVYAEIDEAAPANHSLNATQDSVTQNVESGFDLGSILPIVIAAGAVLAVLIGFGNVGRGGGGRR